MLNRDIYSPTTISILVFMISTLLTYVEKDLWEVDIDLLTVIVISSYFVCATFAEGFGNKIRLKRRFQSKAFNGHILKLPSRLVFFITILVFLLTFLYAVNAFRTGIANGGVGLNAFAYMKNAYMRGSGVRMNPLIRQGFKLVMAFGYIACLFFANNVMVYREKIISNLPYLLIIMCSFAITIFSGSRTEAFRILAALLFDYIILWKESKNWQKMKSDKSAKALIRSAIPFVIIVGILGFASRMLVKTDNTATSTINSIFDYLAYYVGSPVAVLDKKISIAFDGPGLLSFKFHDPGEFVYLGQLDYGGNVATILGRTLFSSGFLITMAFMFLVYTVGTIVYKNLQNTYTSKNRNTILIISSVLYVCFPMSFYADLASGLLEISQLLIILITWILCGFVNKYTKVV